MKTNPYDKLLSRKRKWTPVKPTAGAFKNGAEETIRRCLAIRHMELPVGEFIKEGLEKNVPENARTWHEHLLLLLQLLVLIKVKI